MTKKKAVKGEVQDTETITLRKPLEINGEKHTTLTLHLGELTGEDMEAAEILVRTQGGDITSAHEMNKSYLLALASRACRVNIDDLRKLNIRDSSQVTLLVQGFLLG